MNSTENIDKRFANVDSSKTFNRILDALDLRNKKVLDLGCGFGEYLVKFGKGSLGITTTLGEIEYGKIKNLRIVRGNAELVDDMDLKESFEAVWANNMFEHLLSPHAFLIKLKKISEKNTLLVLGVPVIPGAGFLMRMNKFRGALAVSHVNFFTRKSLRLTVERAGWKVLAVRPFLFKNGFLDKISAYFAPHLYVVARNDVDFRYDEKKLKEWKDEPYYKKILNTVGQ